MRMMLLQHGFSFALSIIRTPLALSHEKGARVPHSMISSFAVSPLRAGEVLRGDRGARRRRLGRPGLPHGAALGEQGRKRELITHLSF